MGWCWLTGVFDSIRTWRRHWASTTSNKIWSNEWWNEYVHQIGISFTISMMYLGRIRQYNQLLRNVSDLIREHDEMKANLAKLQLKVTQVCSSPCTHRWSMLISIQLESASRRVAGNEIPGNRSRLRSRHGWILSSMTMLSSGILESSWKLDQSNCWEKLF